MAITHLEYALLRRLKEGNLLTANPSILELGQSNWYGDVDIESFYEDISRFVFPSSEAERLINYAKSLVTEQPKNFLFDLASIFWRTFLGSHSYKAIDLDGVDDCVYKLDLNEPTNLDQQFDVVCNFGTAEHVFNVYQVFKTIHDLTKPGGWMLHGLPFQGWIDHGFFNFQPTLFFDLAETNGYVPSIMFYAELSPPRIISINNRAKVHELAEKGDIGKNAMLFVALRKRSGKNPFRAPIQGYYARKLDEEAARRWMSLR